MTKLISYFFAIFVIAGLNGCTVGRYVTNVSLGSGESLAVEKCATKKWDMFFWNTECSSTDVTLIPEK